MQYYNLHRMAHNHSGKRYYQENDSYQPANVESPLQICDGRRLFRCRRPLDTGS